MSFTRIASGAVLVAAVTASAALSAVPANAATTAGTGAISASAPSAAAAPFISVTSSESFVPDTRPTISGVSTPAADVYITIPGFPLRNERVRSDAAGNWSYQLTRATSGNFGGNTATVVTAAGAYAQAGFSFFSEYPESTDDSAAFRPIVVDATQKVATGVYEVSGKATPGALIVLRARGLSQGVTVADSAGSWRARVGADGVGPWVQTIAYQQHANGTSSVAFQLTR